MKNFMNRASRETKKLALITGSAAFISLGIMSTAHASNCTMKKSVEVTDVNHHAASSYSAMHPKQAVMSASVSAHDKIAGDTIVDAAIGTSSLSTLVTAVTAADLGGALSGEGPLTVFAPVNSAFSKLPSGVLSSLLKPENQSQLQAILKAHVVAGNLGAADIMSLAKAGGGTAEVQTLSGDTLTAILAGHVLYVKDEQGGLAKVKTADIRKSNGTVHIVDRVLLPK